MRERLCRYCQKTFQPSKHRPEQAVCSDSACQRQRRKDYHRQKISHDTVYRQVCLESPQKWRERNPGYWKQYRQKHPEVVTRNRERQQSRDRKRRLRHLANNNLVLDLRSSPSEVWLIGPAVSDLANNNSASGKMLVFETVIHRLSPPRRACKQHPHGELAAFDS
jgi:hypothetical protein